MIIPLSTEALYSYMNCSDENFFLPNRPFYIDGFTTISTCKLAIYMLKTGIFRNRKFTTSEQIEEKITNFLGYDLKNTLSNTYSIDWDNLAQVFLESGFRLMG